MTNAPNGCGSPETFRITHPFHPFFGKEYSFVSIRCSWGEERVFYHNEEGRFCSLPSGWTDVLGCDPFLKVSEGRAHFRVKELLQLVAQLKRLRALSSVKGEGVGRKGSKENKPSLLRIFCRFVRVNQTIFLKSR